MNPNTRKAVSPVIATVILVAVAITVSVGVSYWMGGISAQYTQFEKVEIQTGYAQVATGGWEVTLTLKNSGSATSTVTQVFINEVPLNATAYGLVDMATFVATAHGIGTDMAATGATMTAGDSTTVKIYVANTYSTLTSGTTVNVKLHSAGGMDYIKLIRLT